MLNAARDVDQGPRHRHRPAASLHPAARPLRRLLLLLQRRRHGDRRAGLCGRRGSDRRRHIRRRWRSASAPAAIATRATWSSPAQIAPLIARTRQARRLRRVPRRRQHHAMGLCAAEANWRPATARMMRGEDLARAAWRQARGHPRAHDAERGDGQDHLVPRRRPGRSAVPAGRRGRPGRLPQGACRQTCR